ncbi:hypothetical protein AMK16_09455 [Streptomyces sp. CB00455]|uniref:hypothetical protein n=1 Tax=Streptomyces sp. CB00455 TaxID=1703927 RepID=UPI00093CCA91|nr:hypothetical protein [Streptomyces sp. CB00455]OKK20665.1 hypothetical protein AMK16_09455 [Streptomyces sp. CB00455]
MDNFDVLLDYLLVLAVAALLLAPALYGILRDRRIERELRLALVREVLVRAGGRRVVHPRTGTTLRGTSWR